MCYRCDVNVTSYITYKEPTMITLKEYVFYKYKSKAVAITEDETVAFGIPYPAPNNWFTEYADFRMSEDSMKVLYSFAYWKSKRMSGRFAGQPSAVAKIAIRTLDTLTELFGKTGMFDTIPIDPFLTPRKPEQKKLTASEKRKIKRLKRKKDKFAYEKVKLLPKKKKFQKQSTSAGVSHIIRKCSVDVTSDAFLSTFEWKALRMQALLLHGAKCQCCGATPQTGAVMHVDHIKPRKYFPTLALELSNLQILCGDCNAGKGNWNQTDWRKIN